jgi:hypothetical protein
MINLLEDLYLDLIDCDYSTFPQILSRVLSDTDIDEYTLCNILNIDETTLESIMCFDTPIKPSDYALLRTKLKKALNKKILQDKLSDSY